VRRLLLKKVPKVARGKALAAITLARKIVRTLGARSSAHKVRILLPQRIRV
jgi:hypothetical protein